MTKLFEHQALIITDGKLKTGIFLGTGGGKTRVALYLGRKKMLIIAPKTQVQDKNWEREASKIDIPCDITVISKETFRRDWEKLPRYDTVIGDESHTLCGVSPSTVRRKGIEIPKTSQLFESVYKYIQKHEPERVYLVSATPAPTPMAVWGAARLLGHTWKFNQFRDRFYTGIRNGFSTRWIPKTDKVSKAAFARMVRSIGYVGRLEDWFDVPEQTFMTKHFPLSDVQADRIREIAVEYPDPAQSMTKIDQIENGVLKATTFTEPEVFACGKNDYILERANEFPRLLIFAKYTDQIRAIRIMLEKAGKKVLVLDGQTKDKGVLIKEANESKECVVIAQSQISSGYALPEYPCVLFASLSGSLVDLIQAYGRVQRMDHLKKNLYIFLVTTGGIDEARYKANMRKEDFNDEIYLIQHDGKTISSRV